jgi:hypothetical protein
MIKLIGKKHALELDEDADANAAALTKWRKY